MKINLFTVAICICAIAGNSVFARGSQAQEPAAVKPAEQTITITDALGRVVTLELPIKTAVSGILVVTEAMTVIGAQDKIVGIDWVTPQYSTLYGDLTKLPVVSSQDFYSPNFEMIYELHPDLYITLANDSMEGLDDMVAKLSPDIPVVTISYDTPEQICSAIEMLGTIFQCEEAAADYIDFYQGTLNFIKERVADISEDEKVRVFYEFGPGYLTFGEGFPAWNIQITIPGGINVAADMKQAYGSIDPETVIVKDPEVIVSLAMSYPFMGADAVAVGYDVNDASGIQAFHESVLNRSELSGMSAIKEKRVHVIMSELPITSVIGYSYFAKWFYPDLFTDLDPKALHQEYLTRFMRIDFDLSKHGVFVYPETN